MNMLSILPLSLVFIVTIMSPLNEVRADEFDDWLNGLSRGEVESYARVLRKTINGWINRGEEQVSNANMNLIALRRAESLSTNAITSNDKSEKIRLVRECLEKIGEMEDIAVLKTFLIVRIVPGVPGKKAVSLGVFLLKAAGKTVLNNSERTEIRQLIEEGTRSSFRQAKHKIIAAENRIFQGN